MLFIYFYWFSLIFITSCQMLARNAQERHVSPNASQQNTRAYLRHHDVQNILPAHTSLNVVDNIGESVQESSVRRMLASKTPERKPGWDRQSKVRDAWPCNTCFYHIFDYLFFKSYTPTHSTNHIHIHTQHLTLPGISHAVGTLSGDAIGVRARKLPCRFSIKFFAKSVRFTGPRLGGKHDWRH